MIKIKLYISERRFVLFALHNCPAHASYLLYFWLEMRSENLYVVKYVIYNMVII